MRRGKGSSQYPCAPPAARWLRLNLAVDAAFNAACANYSAAARAPCGLRHIAGLIHCVAFLEAFTTGTRGKATSRAGTRAAKSQYRRIFIDAGLVPLLMNW